jgi:hypothetical protein
MAGTSPAMTNGGSERRRRLAGAVSSAEPDSRGSYRTVAFDGDAIARARVGPVVPHGAVLDTAVVPEGDGVRVPAETALEERVLRVVVEIAQDAVALVGGDTHDAPREAAIDVKRLLARDRVGPDDRMLGARIALLVLDAEIRLWR